MAENFTHADRKTGIRNTVIALLIIIMVILGLFLNRVLTPRVLSPKEMVNNGAIMFSVPREISAFELVDHNGRSFSKNQLKDNWTFVFFGFTHCPDICPTTLAQFSQLENKLRDTEFADSTRFLLVSLDPVRDTTDVLKQYVEYFSSEFTGVTGDFLQLRRLSQELNVAFQKVVTNHDTGEYTIDHGGNVALINPQGHYHGLYKPPLNVDKMALTYQSVRVENR